jgi:hypothetical protein
MDLPACLLVDDSGPVNVMHWLHPERVHVWEVPNTFTAKFAAVCTEYGIRGKFTVLPMPCGLGRLDQKLASVPARHIQQFLRVVRQRIVPHFDITPEILTHALAVNLDSGRPLHIYETEWVRRANVKSMVPYLVRALEILKNVGLDASGFTSPWDAGIHNESDYVKAMAQAQWAVWRRRTFWYFLHTASQTTPRPPWVAYRHRARCQRGVSICANTSDAFWPTIEARSVKTAMAAARRGADQMISANGESGRIRELLALKCPVTLLTHWQSLFSEGRAAGLAGIELVFQRIRKNDLPLQWMKCSELATKVVNGAKPNK